MGYYFVIAVHLIYFGLMNFLPIAGAAVLAKRLAPDSPPLKYALSVLIYFIQAVIIFSIPGIFGCLDLTGGIIASLLSGGICYFCAKRCFSLPPVTAPPEETTCRFTLFFKVFIGLIAALLIRRSVILAGTDSYLYHLYYPAMWISRGKIFAVTLPGLPHEYFPVAGEVLYGWLMLSGNVVFPPLLQIAAWLMSLCAAAALWRSYGVTKLHLFAGTFLALTCGIVVENAVLCYTDVLTGAFLITGISLLILSHDGKISDRKNQLVLSILAGISMGLAAGVKYSGLVLTPPVTLLLLIRFYLLRPASRKCAWLTAVSAIFTAGAFYMPNFLKTGNPFYPVKIPFLFPQGIDFERDTIPLKNMWHYFVNRNAWDMNIFSAVLLLLMISGIYLLAVRKFFPQNRELARLCISLIFILIAAEILMLGIYPAMTQARQIIPFVMSVCMFFSPVLFMFTGKLISGKISLALYTLLITAAGFLNLNALLWVYWVFPAVAILLILPPGAKYRKIACSVTALLAAAAIYEHCIFRYHSALNCIEIYAGKIAVDITKSLRKDATSVTGHRIASVGSWYNFLLMLDLPGNEVFYVPVNEENTSHPHEAASIADLRGKPVPYPVWKQRLQDAGCTHLVIDLLAHDDFLTNRDLELRWALSHPEDFELLHHQGHIYFFRIK